MLRKIIYPEVLQGAARPAAEAKKIGVVGAVGRVIGGGLLLGGVILSAVLLGSLLFAVMGLVFLVICPIALGVTWRLRHLSRRRLNGEISGLVFTQQIVPIPTPVSDSDDIIDTEAERVPEPRQS